MALRLVQLQVRGNVGQGPTPRRPRAAVGPHPPSRALKPAIPVRRSQGPGPDGNKTLCSTCSARFRSGHTKPPQTNDDGKYVCEACARTFDTMTALGGHKRFCDGGVWRCGWCSVSAEQTSGKGPGPDGASTLCANCAGRFRSGHTTAVLPNADGKYECELCDRIFETIAALGVHRRSCDGGAWRCAWCEVSADQAQGKSPGPDGAGTLCSTCGARFRGGHLGPPPRNAFGQIECECGRAFDKLNALATHKRSCRVAQTMPEE